MNASKATKEAPAHKNLDDIVGMHGMSPQTQPEFPLAGFIFPVNTFLGVLWKPATEETPAAADAR